ncbi:substrate-binding domain-containing protein [Acholeplasma granularum]|uniref:substrate-binding domain-containing protein n=1 Tax=Acholeplasma granularum TaxID=264635 RepID=UPI0004BB09B7|nr:substrate-binding domain-containing protein [Acholeplasma granularum]
MSTLKQVAKVSGVSVSTVSRIINQDPTLSVSSETRRSVIEAAAKLDYKGTSKRKHNSLKIAMLHWFTRTQELEDTYYLTIRLGIEKAAHDLGITLVKVFYDDIKKDIMPLDGAIAIGKFDDEEIKLFKTYYKYIVFVDSSPDPNVFDSVVIDFENAYASAINYLEKLNLFDVGYIGGREYTHAMNKLVGERREQYFKNHYKDHSKIHIGKFSIESGYELMKSAIQSKNLAKAYLVASDAMAIGVLNALYESGIKVPDDISIIGFNDITQSAYTIPPLTTIKVYQEHMGKTALNLLLERINGRHITQKVVIPTKLIIRKSTKEPN